MTLQQVLTNLTTLARERGADLLATIELEAAGATLTIHWNGEAEPREAVLYFGEERGDPDNFLFAFVVSPDRFVWALEEGLSDGQAEGVATQLVETIEDVEHYLTGAPYQHYHPKSS